ncbi:MAG: redoxin domain-containing protein [Pseudomonadota bacterium]
MSMKLNAGDALPKIEVPILNGGALTLGATEAADRWALVIVYRGKHCPLCTRYLGDLNGMLADFDAVGVDVVAVSADPAEKAAAHTQDIGVDFPIGYDLSLDQMKALGLYVSDPRSPEETDRPFAEPGLFVVNANGALQIVDVSNAPFARPDLKTVLMGLKFVRDPANAYPIRGMRQ